MKTATKVNQIRICNLLFVALILLVISYLYFVNAIAINAVSYERNIENINIAETEIAVLQSQILLTRSNLLSKDKTDLKRANPEQSVFVFTADLPRFSINE